MLLDDAQTSVVTAAAQALAALVGPGRDEEEAWRAADDNPTTGDIIPESSRVREARCCKRIELF